MAAATQENIPSGWSILGFVVFIALAIGQLCAMWKPVAEALGNSMSAVLLSCVTGLLLAVPLATESGIDVIYFLDTIVGGSWFVALLWVAQIFGIFLVRGRPYTADILVNDLRLTQTLSAFIALSWNVLLPIGLMTLCILEYKSSNARELYHWRGKSYWPIGARKVGGFMQVGYLLVVPVTAIIQIYRYLSKGPPDILDRIQLLYRPSLVVTSSQQPERCVEPRTERPRPMHAIPATISLETGGASGNDDAPPKYTPPPSYTTATGARIAKMLRNSIRRSVRRILGEPSNNRRQRPPLQQRNGESIQHVDDSSLPPAYSSVLVDPSVYLAQTAIAAHQTQDEVAGPRVLYNSETHRSRTLKMQRRRTTTPELTTTNNSLISSATAASQTMPNARRTRSITAHDVAQILRPSQLECHQRALSLGECVVDQAEVNALQRNTSTVAGRSAENLMLSAAPIGLSSVIDLNVCGNNEPPNNNDNYSSNTSVI